MIGRPAEYSIERDEFAEACAGGLNELELVAHFGGRLNSVIDGDWRSAQFRRDTTGFKNETFLAPSRAAGGAVIYGLRCSNTRGTER